MLEFDYFIRNYVCIKQSKGNWKNYIISDIKEGLSEMCRLLGKKCF